MEMGNGNGEWGMEMGNGNGEWGMGNGEWGMGNGKIFMKEVTRDRTLPKSPSLGDFDFRTPQN